MEVHTLKRKNIEFFYSRLLKESLKMAVYHAMHKLYSHFPGASIFNF